MKLNKKKKPIRIAPSILSANFAYLGEEVKEIEKAGADLIHIDVMDNHYVPNLTIGPLVASSIKPITKLPLDIHLMTKPVDSLIPAFVKAGADIISFHPEATEHIDRTISFIKQEKCKVGLVLNPATPINCLDHVLGKLDVVMLMSVNPGFGGQKLIPYVLDKAKKIYKKIKSVGKDISLEIDGGVNLDNISQIVEAGFDTIVAGSLVFNSENYGKTIQTMRELSSKELK